MEIELIGRKIAEIREMTAEEREAEFWEDRFNNGIVLVLDNGVKLYPSRDHEGNGPGALFGMNTDDKGFIVSGDAA